MRISDWSSDVCSSDLAGVRGLLRGLHGNPRNLFRPRDRPGRGSDAARDTDGACANYHQHRFGAVDARRTTGADAVEPGRCDRADRKSVVSGKSVSVRVDLGGRRIIKKKKKLDNTETTK